MRNATSFMLSIVLPLGLLACGDTGLNGGGETKKSCGGSSPTRCGIGEVCRDDPNDGCDPSKGGVDCPAHCEQAPPGGKPACEDITDAATCRTRSDCETAGCPLCGKEPSFIGCYTLGKGPQIDCPAVACASACGAYDEDACGQHPECHRLYVEAAVCNCTAPGCCMQFDHCAESSAICSPTTGTSEPCPATTCGAGFTPSYVIGEACAEGCVHSLDCLDADQ